MTLEKKGSMDPLDVAIAVLRTKRNQIDTAIAAMEAVRTGGTMGVQVPSPDSVGTKEANSQSGEFIGMTIANAARRLLAARRRPLGTPEVMFGLIEGGMSAPAISIRKVRSALRREAQKGTNIVTVGRGVWALTSWHHNPSCSEKMGLSENEVDEGLLEEAVKALDAPGV